MSRDATTPRFCSRCGTTVASAAKFCSECGADVRTGAAPAGAPQPPWRPTTAGLGLAGFVLVAGLAMWAAILSPAPPRAGLGGPGGGAATAQAPRGRPDTARPVELPAEVKTFIAELAGRAEQAPDDVATWLRLGSVYYRAAQLDPAYHPKALQAFDHVLAREPDNLEAVKGKANVFYDRNDHAQAIPLYERVLKATPDDPNVLTDVATMYLAAGDAKKAIDGYEAVLAKNPDFLQAHYNLAVTHAQLGHTQMALERFRTARRLAPDDATRKQIDDMMARLTGPGPGPPIAGAGGEPGGGEGAPPALPPGHPPIGPSPGATPGASAPAPATAPDRSAPASGVAPGGAAVPPAGGGQAPATAAGAGRTPFQRAVEQAFRGTPVMGERVVGFEWTGAGTGRALVQGFPIDAMPPAVRDRFTGRLAQDLRAAQSAHAPEGPVKIEVADAGAGTVMLTVTP